MCYWYFMYTSLYLSKETHIENIRLHRLILFVNHKISVFVSSETRYCYETKG